MKTRHLVDPELLPLLDQIPPFLFSAETLPDRRRENSERARARAPSLVPPEITVTERIVPGPAGAPDVRVLVYRPVSAPGPLPVLVHAHPGGFVVGLPEGSTGRCCHLAREAGCAVVSVDYRLAPESPFPAAQEDCYAVLKWAHGQAAALGLDPGRIAVGGESAGGGLAASLALLARDRGEVPLVFQMLIYPMIDDRTGLSHDPGPYAGEHVWTRAGNDFGWAALLGAARGGAAVSPYAAPARAIDLSGLPPAFIAVGALDLLVEEDIAYAQKLMRAGVPTELHVYPGAFHGFDIADAAVARAFLRDCTAALARALAKTPLTHEQPVTCV